MASDRSVCLCIEGNDHQVATVAVVNCPVHGSPTWEIREGDALERLREMPDESVHCCVTSPPYYGLRDYGIDGQIGLEETLDGYIAALVAVFDEVRRVLRTDGTLWLNLGDSYAGSWGAQGRDGAMADRAVSVARSPSGSSTLRGNGHLGGGPKLSALSNTQVAAAPKGKSGTGSIPDGAGYKPKDLIGVPWSAAFALRSAGWWLRQEIIWHKLSPMPESVRDRCTRAHEQVFMLAKSARYFYDAAAIAEDAVSDHASGNGYARDERETYRNRNRRDVWTLSSQPFPEAHFATFPPKLVEPCILAGCPEGGVVLDPFSGAGTTGVVALRHGRSYVGIELNPEYAELSRNRIRGDAPLLNTPAEMAA